MKHKVSELEGALLDAAVAKTFVFWPNEIYVRHHSRGSSCWLRYKNYRPTPRELLFSPSRKWKQGGHFIEQERIQLVPPPSGTDLGWAGVIIEMDADRPTHMGAGPTPLIAAMRCFVASKFGDEVDL